MAQTLDPLVSLAFSLRANPGVYALLIGSGVSRSAGIPTGWEVVLDLIRRVAAAHSELPGEQPDQWYAKKYDKEASYSDLLDQLCHTRIERQQLLKGYFEPTSDEREQGIKLPTPAHRAVAELMELGLVRVVITTNFDRLLEQALEQRRIVPVVIGSPDQALGMIPLAHQKHCIIKVHGDYLDTRILNTEDELLTYDPAIAGLIDRVFDEFGLIVCGWSATWDPALRASINRAISRRYSCFWTSNSELSEEARQVVSGKSADLIKILAADSFFEGLLDRVRGLEEFDRPHPLGVQAAVGAAKRYLADDTHRIRLHDLYREALTVAKAIWAGPTFPAFGTPAPAADTNAARIRAYDASAGTVVALNAAIGRWSRGEHDDMLVNAIGDVGKETSIPGTQYTLWSNLRAYPATLMLYAAGMASIIANRPTLLSRLLTVRTSTPSDKDEIAVSRLAAPRLGSPSDFSGLFGGNHRHVPMSDWLHGALRETFRGYVGDNEEFNLLFDTFEYYFALGFVGSKLSAAHWVPFGAWAAHRHNSHTTILAGLNGSEVQYGGKEFAAGCAAFTRNGKALKENLAEVEASRNGRAFF